MQLLVPLLSSPLSAKPSLGRLRPLTLSLSLLSYDKLPTQTILQIDLCVCAKLMPMNPSKVPSSQAITRTKPACPPPAGGAERVQQVPASTPTSPASREVLCRLPFRVPPPSSLYSQHQRTSLEKKKKKSYYFCRAQLFTPLTTLVMLVMPL